MPEDGREIAAPDGRTIVALSERVAVIETQQKALKEDTGVIRSSIHGINNEMQKFVQAEQRCVDALAQISQQTKELPSIAMATSAFLEMRADIKSVIDDRQQRIGIAELSKRAALLVSSIAAVIVICGGIAGLLLWMMRYAPR